jgi:hypothetical protein
MTPIAAGGRSGRRSGEHPRHVQAVTLRTVQLPIVASCLPLPGPVAWPPKRRLAVLRMAFRSPSQTPDFTPGYLTVLKH